MSLDELKTSRKMLVGRITRIYTYVSSKFNPESDNISNLEVRLDELKNIWSEYQKIQGDLEQIDASHETHREVGEDKYFTTVSLINESIKKLKNSNIQTSNQTFDSQPRVNLPQLKIPQFDGRYDQWKGFIDIFTTVIHHNQNISDVERLFYLKSNLKGEALKVIEGISVSAEAYQTSLELLTERYDNQYLIINSHIKALFDLPHVSKDVTSSLRTLIVESKQHLRSIKSFNIKIEEWDPIIVFMLSSKLDHSTRTAWELSKPKKGLPSLEDLYQFIEQRCISFENINDRSSKPVQQPHSFKAKPLKSFVTSQGKAKCSVCQYDFHNLYYCKKFVNLPPQRRLEATIAAKMCTNCLRQGHNSHDCPVTLHCKKCNKPHHTLLHEANDLELQAPKVAQETPSSTSSCFATLNCPDSQIVLSTISLDVIHGGQPFQCRAILDNASQPNLITKNFVKTHNIPTYSKTVNVSAIRNLSTVSSLAARLTVSSRVCNFKHALEFLVVDVITSEVPSQNLNKHKFQIPDHFKMADPNFAEPGPIDMLIGGELFAKILGQTKYKLGHDMPYIIQTAFGWIISGKLATNANSFTKGEQKSFLTATGPISNNSLDQTLRQFWEIEHTFNASPPLSLEEKLCEQQYNATTSRNSSGRYIVQYPLREPPESLGESYSSALNRLEQMEKRFDKNIHLQGEYKKFMSEYLHLDHMELVTDDSKNKINYLPHHAVFKDDKIRVVFDGSSKTSNGISLNDIMLIGPIVQQDLFSIITRFRKHKVAFTLDIAKMYRQILVDKGQTDLQRILWRDDKSEDVKEYRLKTVTYGTAAAPYLATKTIQRLALDQVQNFPYASKRVLHDTYVDDVMTGANSVNDAKSLKAEIIQMFSQAGFHLHKWCSNHPELMPGTEETRESNSHFLPETIKTLGLIWSPQNDTFQFSTNTKNRISSTKREILSDIAAIFDPLGILGPIITDAKLFIQELWKQKIDWDTPLDQPTVSKWENWKSQLPDIRNLEIPRCIVPLTNISHYDLHGFCDASERAYGAVIYLKSSDQNKSSVIRLVTSKSRIAPIKSTTLPRLELNGALILAKLISKIIDSLEITCSSVTLWTDSSIVLSWLNDQPSRWTTYVANRVSAIQELTSNYKWKHVRSECNPADILSRGSSIQSLKTSPLWWEGPDWLLESETNWPKSSANIPEVIPEIRPIRQISLVSTQDSCIISKFSKFTRLTRVIAFCLKFVKNLREKVQGNPVINQSLTPADINEATMKLIKIAQLQEFKEEIKFLSKNRPISPSSKLICLNPFLDDHQILRVGGRLINAPFPFEQRHPIILPEKHHLSKLIMTHEHIRLLHAGQQATLVSLRRRYWIINAKRQLRLIIHKCIPCFKFRAKGNVQIMAPLPKERVTQQLRAFINTGVDFAGPLFIKMSKRKNAPLEKGFIALFVCLATRAIHLELVSNLTTEAFMLALSRFISRRGICQTIFSDNGTNFKGANNELRELYQLFRSQDTKNKIINSSCTKGIEWKFIPPNSPHFGGIWEAGVKSCKHHIKRVMGNANLTFEETYTLLTEIEACLNSRPLTPISSDPSNFEFITPGHFLINDFITHLPVPNYAEIPLNTLSRWQLVQRLNQHFWKIWSRDYLSTLQTRYKWQTSQPDLIKDKLVILKEDNVPPLCWQLARIKDIITGPDGHARIATIVTSKGATLQRPIVKLCPLPSDSE